MRTSCSSPMCASVTGASIPAAAHVAPIPGVGSHRVTLSPCLAALQAVESPITPAPAMTTSGEPDVEERLCTRCILRKLRLGQSRPGRTTRYRVAATRARDENEELSQMRRLDESTSADGTQVAPNGIDRRAPARTAAAPLTPGLYDRSFEHDACGI